MTHSLDFFQHKEPQWSTNGLDTSSQPGTGARATGVTHPAREEAGNKTTTGYAQTYGTHSVHSLSQRGYAPGNHNSFRSKGSARDSCKPTRDNKHRANKVDTQHIILPKQDEKKNSDATTETLSPNHPKPITNEDRQYSKQFLLHTYLLCRYEMKAFDTHNPNRLRCKEFTDIPDRKRAKRITEHRGTGQK